MKHHCSQWCCSFRAFGGTASRVVLAWLCRHPVRSSVYCPELPRSFPERVAEPGAGRPAGLLQSCSRTAQVLLRRKCSEDGSEDSSYWEQGAEDLAPEAASQDLDTLHQEWKVLTLSDACQGAIHNALQSFVSARVSIWISFL